MLHAAFHTHTVLYHSVKCGKPHPSCKFRCSAVEPHPHFFLHPPRPVRSRGMQEEMRVGFHRTTTELAGRVWLPAFHTVVEDSVSVEGSVEHGRQSALPAGSARSSGVQETKRMTLRMAV